MNRKEGFWVFAIGIGLVCYRIIDMFPACIVWLIAIIKGNV